MKTNLTDLMSRVSKLEKESSYLQYDNRIKWAYRNNRRKQ